MIERMDCLPGKKMNGMLQIKISMKIMRSVMENQELSVCRFSKILGLMFVMPKVREERRPSIV